MSENLLKMPFENIVPKCDNLETTEFNYRGTVLHLKTNHPLMFSTAAHLSFVIPSNWKDPFKCPILCAKCKHPFTRSIEADKTKVKLACTGKNSGNCNVTATMDNLKAFLMDLVDHQKLFVIPNSTEGQPSKYYLVFKDGEKTQKVKFESPRFDEDWKVPLFNKIVHPSLNRKSLSKNCMDLRNLFYCPYDYSKSPVNDDITENRNVLKIFFNIPKNDVFSVNIEAEKLPLSTFPFNENASMELFSPEEKSTSNIITFEEAMKKTLNPNDDNINYKGKKEQIVNDFMEREANSNDYLEMGREENADDYMEQEQNNNPIPEIKNQIEYLNERLTNQELLIKKMASQLNYIFNLETKNDNQVREQIKRVRDKVSRISTSSNLLLSSKRIPSISYSEIASRKANSQSRINAIVERRKLVEKKLKEKEKKITEKCENIKENLNLIGEALPETLRNILNEEGGLEKIQKGVIGLTSTPNSQPSYMEYTPIHIKGIKKTFIRNVKFYLKNLGVHLGKILNITFHGNNIAEFLIYKSYKNEFISLIKSFPTEMEIIENFNPLKPTETLTKEEEEKLEMDLISNINGILSRNGCKDSVKDFYYNYLSNTNFTYMNSFVKNILSSQQSLRESSTPSINFDKINEDDDAFSTSEDDDAFSTSEDDENNSNNDSSSVVQQNDKDLVDDSTTLTSMTIENDNNNFSTITPTISLNKECENKFSSVIPTDILSESGLTNNDNDYELIDSPIEVEINLENNSSKSNNPENKLISNQKSSENGKLKNVETFKTYNPHQQISNNSKISKNTGIEIIHNVSKQLRSTGKNIKKSKLIQLNSSNKILLNQHLNEASSSNYSDNSKEATPIYDLDTPSPSYSSDSTSD